MSSKLYANRNKIIGHDKHKRSIYEKLFVNGNNICKLVLGVSFPVETRDKVNFRTLNLAYNFQAQYMLVRPAQYPWEKVKRSLHNQKEEFLDRKEVVPDNTRQLMYNAVEILMDRKGIDGKECLQRAICENAQSPIAVTGVFHEILNLFLTPSGDADQCFTDARTAGLKHEDCLMLYRNCPMGRGIFDSIFHFKT
ncbi:uncharacterized protein LOC119066838 [Bradysia coprophila]|uniref:uncharacterized protein LOC119066838 n=1 Tax=Bradysia coprophila TaxID=38358 RepID=UPI00187DD75D|nr:uncharacterized protein LOC119066838 [Bradysia coprophila]